MKTLFRRIAQALPGMESQSADGKEQSKCVLQIVLSRYGDHLRLFATWCVLTSHPDIVQKVDLNNSDASESSSCAC